jgi:hypothetical protein
LSLIQLFSFLFPGVLMNLIIFEAFSKRGLLVF